MASLKKFAYIFIPVLAVLLMSHNTNAAKPVIDLNSYELKYYYNQTQDCGFTDSSLDTTNNYYCYLRGNNEILYKVSSNNTYSLKKGDIIEFYFIVSSPTNNLNALVYNDFIQPINSTSAAHILDIELLDNSSFHNYSESALIPSGYYFNKIFKITLLQNSDQTSSIGLGNNRNVSLYRVGIDGGFPTNYFIAVSLRQGRIWRYVGSSEDEAAQKELESTSNIENQTSDDYEMQSANMSSLFSQFGGFITAVSGAHVGDCNIPANLNHINLGILNLCDNPVPDYAQVAVSIIVCMLIAPYLLNIIKRIIGIADKVREV